MTKQELTADQFDQFLDEGVTPVKDFRPVAFYNRDGDCIEFFLSNEPFKAKRIDDLLTVYISRRSDEVVGSLIKGVSKIFREIPKVLPGFKVVIHDDRIKMEHLFTACLWSSERDPQGTEVVVYEKLRRFALEQNIEADARELCLA